VRFLAFCLLKTKQYILLPIVALIFACSDRDEGFTEGPFLQVYNATGGELNLLFDNNGSISDSVDCRQQAITIVPIDMHARQMNFTARGKDSMSRLSIAYNTIVRKRNTDIKLNLTNVVATFDTAANEHEFYIGETFNQIGASSDELWELTENSNWDFINESGNVLWIK